MPAARRDVISQKFFRRPGIRCASQKRIVIDAGYGRSAVRVGEQVSKNDKSHIPNSRLTPVIENVVVDFGFVVQLVDQKRRRLITVRDQIFHHRQVIVFRVLESAFGGYSADFSKVDLSERRRR